MAHSRRSRALRGVLTAAVACYVALAAHVLAGGEPPHPLGVLVPLVLASAACVPLAGRRWSWPRRIDAVSVSQLLFHQLFLLGSVGTATVPGSVGSATTAHAGHGSGSGVDLVPALSTVAAPPAAACASMVALHLSAAVLTVLMLGAAAAAATALGRSGGLRRIAALFRGTVVTARRSAATAVSGRSAAVPSPRRGPRGSRAPPRTANAPGARPLPVPA
ncbi:hypothetical protein [Mycetocola reblochoni]|uniref:hypothetical protein n=1 Tax=Mycetocola reblochoni TaxID=331618 RepID=UPI003F94DE5D